MANISEAAAWTEGIYQLETTDPVEGGPEGVDNLQAKQLANRTKYLKALVEGLAEGKQPLDATLTALAAMATAANQLIYATGSDTFATTALTAFARTLLDDTDAATARATLAAAPLASPALTGTPTAPTAAVGTNTTQISTTAFVQAAIAALVDSSPTTLNTLNELATALGDDPNFAATITTALANKQPLDATLTALAALATAADKMIYATGSDTFSTATLTAFARTLLDDADAATARTTLAAAPLASPALTGTPTAPTAAVGTNTTQISTTAFVQAAIAALVDSSPTTLNTLNELATALGDDPNFAATITTALANKQPLDATLTALAALATAADKMIYATGSDAFATATLTAFARTLLDDANAATARATLGIDLIPAGAVIHVTGNVAPAGCIKGNGALLSRTSYATLWAWAQASGNIAASDGVWTRGQYSPGDGATTFRVPDLRGDFNRNWDDGAGIDPGRAIGSWQGFATQDHTHSSAAAVSGAQILTAGSTGAAMNGTTTGPMNTGIVASETRPRNVALLACIKY